MTKKRLPLEDDPAFLDLNNDVWNESDEDWDAFNAGRDMAVYRQFLHGQVRELLTDYGTIDIMWFDWTPPIDTSVSAPDAMASGTMYSSLRSLFPPIARPELQSSRLA